MAWLGSVALIVLALVLFFGASVGLFYGAPFTVLAFCAIFASRIAPRYRRIAFFTAFASAAALLLASTSYTTLRVNGVDLIVDGSFTKDGYLYYGGMISGLAVAVVVLQWVLASVFTKRMGRT
ncbi:MAG: hypothetical protein AAFN79_16455 [Pseudomonadota bacterium]